MRTFHFHIHPFPSVGCTSCGTVCIYGHAVTKWNVVDVERTAFDLSFEQLEGQLSQLPRMFFEMDGSFVWRGDSQMIGDATVQQWQIDGMVYDVCGSVCRLELKGQSPSAPFAQVVNALHPANRLLAFCIDQNCFVDVSEILQVWDR